MDQDEKRELHQALDKLVMGKFHPGTGYLLSKLAQAILQESSIGVVTDNVELVRWCDIPEAEKIPQGSKYREGSSHIVLFTMGVPRICHAVETRPNGYVAALSRSTGDLHIMHEDSVWVLRPINPNSQEKT